MDRRPYNSVGSCTISLVNLHTIIGAKRLEGRVFEFFAKDKIVSIAAVRAG